ncbi:MAG TPA: enoyl-CoA hydratase [Methylocystis sp.]|nr:enoyl-CoA hydratase [Methylocystis sp.]
MTQIVSSSEKIRVETAQGVARVLIDNAPRRNAFDLSMWRGLPDILRQIETRDELRVVILSAAQGLPFCSGADISEFSTLRATAAGGRAYEKINLEAFDALAQISKPTIAAISGFCMGGGMGLACACDLRIAMEGTVFAIPAGKLGVGYPPAAMPYVVEAVGQQTAMELFFTARRMDAQEAFSRGFLARLLPRETFDEAVAQLGNEIAANAPLTLRAAKAAIRAAARSRGAPDGEHCEALAAACFDSADYAEGRAAFLHKRPPKFEGR